jgi:DNA-binding NtrC family response regulator
MGAEDESTSLLPPMVRAALEFPSITLTVLSGPDRDARLRLTGETARIGTGEQCTLRLKDPTVSRLHCALEVGRNSVRVVDSGSKNGTFIEGVRARDADVTSGSTLRIGGTTVRLDFGDDSVRVPLSEKTVLGGIIGSSVEMRRLYAILERVAPTDATVLIQGETGTGKEVVAQAIHALSRRAKGPFVAVDCGSITESLIESELFGHVRGAFSGAMATRAGLFEEADGGTIFLDEIGELPPALQPKLLRVLESREVRRIGANTSKKIDVRVLAATNRDLAHGVNEGSFREDLYFRLAVVVAQLPPLRARRDDIPALVQHFYERITGPGSVAPKELVSSLIVRAWPGNVRELRNVVERSVSLGWGGERPAAPESRPVLPAGLAALVPVDLGLKEARQAWIEQFENVYVRALLEKTDGNVSRAAEAAGVNRRFLQRLMARLGLRSAEGGDDESEGSEVPSANVRVRPARGRSQRGQRAIFVSAASRAKSEVLAVTTIAPWRRAVRAISASF